jgi:hypothetical protein
MQAAQRRWAGAWIFSSCKVGEECISPGIYAVLGAASALAGVTRLTGINHSQYFWSFDVDDSIAGGHHV